jgi:hypothetical protein
MNGASHHITCNVITGDEGAGKHLETVKFIAEE